VIPIAWRELKELVPAGETAAAGPSSWELQATGCDPEAKKGLPEALKVVEALQQLVVSHKLDAVTVRCFDLVLQLRTTGCLALAQLNANGMVAGCEGDLVSTLGMLWASLLTGELPWMANPAIVDMAENRLLVAHCTVTPGLISTYRLRTHFESGLGVALAGEWIAGPVTLLRLGGNRLEKLWIAEGEATAGPGSELLCRTQVQVALTRGHVADLLQAPLGNHLVVVPGRHAERLENWHRQYGPGAELREVAG
jgi:L-fucose isomerase-like protein